jgi:hypothetical protein
MFHVVYLNRHGLYFEDKKRIRIMLILIFLCFKQDFIRQTAILFISSALFLLASGIASANDVLKDFTFTTIDGKTYDADTLNDSPLVINIMSHW